MCAVLFLPKSLGESGGPSALKKDRFLGSLTRSLTQQVSLNERLLYADPVLGAQKAVVGK